MKLTLGQAHSLLIGLSAIDRDDKTKLGAATRLAIAINISRLQPLVGAYEKTRNALMIEVAGDGPVTPLKEAQFAAADCAMREREETLELKLIGKVELRLDDNLRITGTLIAMLAPILSDLED